MRILSFLILNLITVFQDRPAIQPHGPDFRISCSICHSSSGWHLDKEIYSFNHNATSFSLAGEHKEVDCRQCHPTLIFKDAKSQCIDCHNDVHQATLGPDCSRCHSPKSWLVENISEIHRMSRFPLEGAHRTADCYDCHKSESLVRFDVPGVNCIDCHRQDYQSAREPDHIQAGFPEDCSFCHQVNDFQWTESEFIHDMFPLQQGHSFAKCEDCHTTRSYSDVSRECFQCHQDDYMGSDSPDHNASQLPTDCQNCHTLAAGWRPTLYDHSIFPLTFGHSSPACIECHVGGSYSNTNPDCFSCHQTDYNDSKNPNHQAAGFTNVCMTCHSTNPGWNPSTFSHGKFPLEQAHTIPDCNDCHIGDNYTTLATDCYSCHTNEYNEAANPNHSSAGFPQTCETCHTAIPGWKPANFNHTSFPLTGGHSTPLCIDCHKGGDYTSTPADCSSCHQEDYLTTANPSHTAAGFSQDCLTCHTTDPGWIPTTFSHPGFSLTLGHSTPDCIDCHIGEVYSGIQTECYSCHQPEYAASSNPKHSAAGFSTVCQTCHTANPGWEPTSFNHSSFPLTGGHTVPECNDCHIGDNYTSVPADCYACHQQDYLSAADPSHIDAMFPQTCQTCHSTNPGWEPTTFSHGTFPLTLGHSAVSCNDCHIAGNYTSTPSDCYSCHQQNYLNTADPNHTAAGFATTCQTCHSTNPGWQPTTFDHSFFALTLGHSGHTCIECHTGENYTTTPTDCYGCHQPDYTLAADPNHVTNAFPLVCQTCHSTNPGWSPTTYNHSTFPLTFGHSTPECADCHTGGNYTTTPTDCYSCHQTDYNTAANPNHVTNSFPQVCQTCHSTNPGWTPTTYNHSTFPLTLGHAVPQCSDCHIGGNYTTTPTDCYSCHQTDYTNATNPNHLSAAFSQVCQTCHTTNPGWQPASFLQHDDLYFPIYSGNHNGEWDSCTECHTNPSDYNIFSCIDCHEHSNQIETNSDHSGVSGYSYTSSACYDCHPRGNAD